MRPNIIYIFPDEFRKQSLGFYKEDPVLTPNLDKFAKESVVMNKAISNFPVCSPYRAMLFTGKYPYSSGVITNCNPVTIKHGVYLKKDEICLSDVLFNNAYNTGYIGKYHLDAPNIDPSSWDAYNEKERRHSFEFWYSYGISNDHMNPHYWTTNAKKDEAIYIKEWSVKHETDIAIDYIKNENGSIRDQNKPFALFLAYNPPHMPFDKVPEKYKKVYKNKDIGELLNRKNATATDRVKKNIANYFSAVTGIDEQFGRLMNVLKVKGLYSNTIVIFTSDHGETMGSHYDDLMKTDTDKLKQREGIGKDYWCNESVNVPFLIRYPEKLAPHHNETIFSAVDIMPTLLSLLDLGDKIPSCVEGDDISAYLYKDNQNLDRYAYYGNTFIHARGVISNTHTYAIQKFRDNSYREFLYDDKNDVYQMDNIIDKDEINSQKMREKFYNLCNNAKDPWINNDYILFDEI